MTPEATPMTMRDATIDFDVLAIGNALVDVLAQEPDSFLDDHSLVKGSMTLIDALHAEALYDAMGPGVEVSGGSAANTTVGIASFGGRSAFIGRVKDDQLGTVFAHDIRAAGVHYSTPATKTGPPSGRCLILVTPDAQRTMGTFLGSSSFLTPDDVDASLVQRSAVTYLEGYLWDEPDAKAAFIYAANLAHEAGRRVALSLSDAFVVDRHRAEFLDLVDGHIDLLFANEVEICSLYETEDFDVALQRVSGHCEVAALTRGEKGAVIVSSDAVHIIDAAKATRVEDTTGAGDLFAAGFLYGFTHGYELSVCGHLGALAALEVIGHMGARPMVSLAELAAPLL
ncbi:MAG: adenosine kinase [Actinomycetes bacterium]